MKILSVIEAFCHGGAQTVLLDLVLSLPEHQHRVVHFSRANNILAHRTFVDALTNAGIECHDTHWDSLRTADARAKLLDGFHPDVVLFHWWGSDPWISWVHALEFSRPAFICVLHHHDIVAQEGYDHYVLVSRTQLRQVAHLPERRISVIPNGVDLRRFSDDSKNYCRPLFNGDRPFVIGRLSELREGKIPVEWPAILASYQLEDTSFVIAGNGPLLEGLKASARGLTMSGEVSFPGYIPREEVPGLLRTFDVFCYATSTAEECCPLVVLEAMASGLPVVAEARGGLMEIIKHGESGLLARSTEEIGEHLRLLRYDPGLRRQLSRGARAAAESFALNKQISAFRQLLAETEKRRY